MLSDQIKGKIMLVQPVLKFRLVLSETVTFILLSLFRKIHKKCASNLVCIQDLYTKWLYCISTESLKGHPPFCAHCSNFFQT